MMMMKKAVDPSTPVVPTKSNHSLVATMLVVAACLLPEVAFAASSTNPVLTMINAIISFLNTGVMRGIAIIALFALGTLCYRGKLSFEHAAYACGGIIFTFGGAGLVDQFSGYV